MYIHIYVCMCVYIHRKWQPTPVFLPGEFHGQKSLEGYTPCKRVRSDLATKQQDKLWGWGKPAGSSPGWDVGLHCQGLLARSPQPESRAGENNWCPVVGKAVFLGVPLGMSSSTLYQWNLILCQLPKEERLKGQLHFHRLGNKGWIWGNRQ